MFAQDGIEVTVFIPREKGPGRSIIQQETNLRLVYFRHGKSPQNKFLGSEAALSFEFALVLREFEQAEGCPDFIESQEYGGIAYYPLQFRHLDENFLNKATFFLTAHAPSFLYLDFNQAPCYQFPEFWVGEMEKSALRSADFVLSPSQYILDRISERISLQGVTLSLIRNPFVPYSLAEAFDHGDLVFFGKLTPQKGGLEMLSYLRDMWDEGFTGRLRLIGGGTHYFYPRLMDMVDYVRKVYGEYIRRGLLTIQGHVPPKQLQEYLLRAHVVIVPSIVDNLPYTVLEAMSMGKVVLASAQGGHAELIQHATNGFLFTHEDKHSFSASLQEILSLPNEEILKIGRVAQETIARECSYSTVVSKKRKLLQTLTSNRSKNEFPYIRPRARTVTVQDKELKEGLLSIVVPYYNLGKYLDSCIRSAIDSGYPNKEIIVVDDGSTQAASISALQEAERRYNIQVLRRRNKGLCATRNETAELVQGEFLAFLDADDMIDPRFYSKAIAILDRFQNVSFVGCWAKYFGENEAIWPAFNPEPPYLLTHNMVNSSALVYRTTHFLTSGKNDPTMIYGMEDYESIINMVKLGYQGVILPEILWNYRIRKGSMAQSFNRYSEQYLYRKIAAKHNDFMKEYAEEVTNILNANGPGMSYNNPTVAVPHGLLRFIEALNPRLVTFVRRNNLLRKIAKTVYKNFSILK